MRNLGPSMRPAAWARRLAIVGVIGAFNVPVVAPWAQAEYHDVKINRSSYKAQHGHWDMLPVPKDYQVHAIHAALLYTGKVLLIAGSGNDRKSFEAGSFKSLLWDPETNKYKLIHTPDDMFCGGHAFLPDGKLLIAGGTKRYEVLEGEVHNAAGVMTVSNESPDQAVALAKGTPFRAADGRIYRTQEAARLPRAAKTGAGRAVKVTASKTEVWVMAEVRGKGSVIKTTKMKKFKVGGMQGAQRRNVYGQANLITLDKQDFQGEKQSYLFDPATERYEKVDDMTLARWYPTLVGLKDGKVLSVSGLDSFGRMIEGTNEVYDPKTKQWTVREDLQRTFPTYPSLFLMTGKGNRLFYTGSNAGYGSPEVGRVPGIWNLDKNTFKKVPGLRSPKETETSGSVLLSPAQDQKYMIVGGGGVGESHKSTSRMDVVDLKQANPRFKAAGNLATGTRYPNLVLTPNDKVVITGGSADYRGKGDSNLLYCNLYDPKTGRLKQMADPTVGRNYHSEALLLPDGRIITMGSDPLFNKDDTGPGSFEKRIEIYTPPYLYQGKRPELTGGPQELAQGETGTFTTPDPNAVETVRLMRPSAVTHVTDVEQRAIALKFERGDGTLSVTVPKEAGLVPAGWYMLFANDAHGTPSIARWVHVT